MTNRILPVLLLPAALLLAGAVMMWLTFGHLEAAALEQRQSRLLADAEQLGLLLGGDQRLLQEVGTRRGLNYYYGVINSRPVLDGRDDDWQGVGESTIEAVPASRVATRAVSIAYDLKLAKHGGFLYLHYRVRDDSVVYRSLRHSGLHRNDHVQISLVDQDGHFQRFTLSTEGPGYVEANEVGRGLRSLRSVPEITGRWLKTAVGYNLEIQIPEQLVAQRFSTLVADVDIPGQKPCCYVGRSDTEEPADLGYLVQRPTALETLVENQARSVTLIGKTGQVLAQSERWPTEGFIEVTAPMVNGSQPLGSVVMRQVTGQLESTWHARNLQLGVLVALGLGVMLLSFRHSLLRLRQHDTQLDSELERVANYNHYLERMAGRMNHELQTPVSIIRSSLEQIEVGRAGQVYLERAIEGLRRLSGILAKMSEARRLEEALDEDEVVRFDLAQAVIGCFEGYRLAHPDYEFELTVVDNDIPITGIPELIAQSLDKIVDNAVEFSTTRRVMACLCKEDDMALLTVRNEGSILPLDDHESLFESMVSFREPDGEHLGLGLYVAKTIVEYHGGSISLKNTDDSSGVVATVHLPILRLSSKLLPSFRDKRD